MDWYVNKEKNMPAYITHYTCGIINYRELKEGNVKDIIRRQPHAYCVGLAGPDVFFYDFFDLIRPGISIGTMLHEKNTGLFLKNLFLCANSFTGKQKEIALSYFIGFVGHYMLDCNAHPLVYEVTGNDTKKNLAAHFRYEGAMDVFIAREFLGRDVAKISAPRLTHLKRREEATIKRLLKSALNRTYQGRHPVSYLQISVNFFYYHLITFLIKDDSGIREKLYGQVEKRLLGFSFAAALFVNNNTYDVTKTDYLMFRERFKQGLQDFEACMLILEDVLQGKADKQKLFACIGSRSYHTGEDV